MPEGLVPGSVRLVRWLWQALQSRSSAAAARPSEELKP
jgi:hypothetical protein